jgi:hypothetical protein
VYVWKHQGNHYQTRPPHPLSSTEGGITWWFGDVWAQIGWGSW